MSLNIPRLDAVWRDGAFYSPVFDDVFFSRHDGFAEAEHVYLRGNGLPARWQRRDRFVIAELGFGTGLNFLVTAWHWLEHSRPGSLLFYIGVDRCAPSEDVVWQVVKRWPQLTRLGRSLCGELPPPVAGMHRRVLAGGAIRLQLCFGEAAEVLAGLSAAVDAWYWDGFAPSRNPDMWSPPVGMQMARLSAPQATVASYSCAGVVRRVLQEAGFAVARRPGFAAKKTMLVGRRECSISVNDATAPWFDWTAGRANEGVREAVVVGAGVAGVHAGLALRRRGWKVIVVDRHDRPFAAGSGSPAVVLAPALNAAMDDYARWSLAANLYALSGYRQWLDGGAGSGWHPDGVVRLTESMARAEAIAAQLPEAVVGTDVEEPGLPPLGDRGRLFFPRAAWLEPLRLARWLTVNSDHGLSWRWGWTLTSCRYARSGWQLEFNGGEHSLQTANVILASARDCQAFVAPGLLELLPVAGQVTWVRASRDSERLAMPVCFGGCLTPAVDGRHCVGATYHRDLQSVPDPARADQENLARLNAALRPWYWPPGAVEGGHGGVRAVTPDRMPVVGPVADVAFYRRAYRRLHDGRPAQHYARAQYLPGLFLTAGYGSAGFSAAVLAAEVLADVLEGTPLPISLRQAGRLHSARFLIRRLKRGPPRKGCDTSPDL